MVTLGRDFKLFMAAKPEKYSVADPVDKQDGYTRLLISKYQATNTNIGELMFKLGFEATRPIEMFDDDSDYILFRQCKRVLYFLADELFEI
jgi:hypothetical protein